jgi:hypothetical protein
MQKTFEFAKYTVAINLMHKYIQLHYKYMVWCVVRYNYTYQLAVLGVTYAVLADLKGY